jgi:hypothetical protein
MKRKKRPRPVTIQERPVTIQELERDFIKVGLIPRMSRKRLPEQVALVLDEKMINLLRYYQMFDDEMAKPQKKLIHVSEISDMLVERLQWLFHDQFPRSKFIWGAMKQNSSLPDKMPKTLQRAVKRYKERNGL